MNIRSQLEKHAKSLALALELQSIIIESYPNDTEEGAATQKRLLNMKPNDFEGIQEIIRLIIVKHPGTTKDKAKKQIALRNFFSENTRVSVNELLIETKPLPVNELLIETKPLPGYHYSAL